MPDTVPPPPPRTDDAGADSRAAAASFEEWAAVSARLFRRPVPVAAALIHDAGFDATWAELDSHWFRVLEADLARGELTRVDMYQKLVDEERVRREEEGDPVPDPTEEAMPPERYPAAPRGRHNSETPTLSSSIPPPSEGVDATAASHNAADAVRWPLEKYAWLVAELEHAPDRGTQIWALHGLASEASQRTVREAWEAKLDEDEPLRDELERLVERYKKVLAGD
ncbi:MAG: hypothetical protein R3B72_48990 [Polyangiaceae bacterium]